MTVNLKKISFFYVFLCILIGLELIFIISSLISYEYITTVFFARNKDMFMDYFNVANKVYDFNPYKYLFDKCYSNYPAFAYLIIYPFSLIAKNEFITNSPKDVMGLSSYYTKITFLGELSYILFALIFIVLLIILIKKYLKFNTLKTAALIFALFLSYPVLFSMERGNVIIYTFLFTLFFIVYYQSRNKILRELSLISLACAFASKFYPLIFAILLLKKGKILPLIRLSLYCMLLFIVPFMIFEGGFSNIGNFYDYFKITLTHYTTYSQAEFLTHNYSIESVFTGLNIIRFDEIQSPYFFYLKLFFLTAGCASVLFIKKDWKAAFLLTNMCVFIPVVSYGYILLFYIIPLIMFLKENEKKPFDLFYLFFFIIVFMPVQLGVLLTFYYITYTINTLIIGIFVLITTIIVIMEGVFNFKIFVNKYYRDRSI